ncbi:hypothetical protein J6590_070438 [Homalodisca vitripennis]|nr:hypothetical protein J6590_070438 [Homalodisca vitripennis]
MDQVYTHSGVAADVLTTGAPLNHRHGPGLYTLWSCCRRTDHWSVCNITVESQTWTRSIHTLELLQTY